MFGQIQNVSIRGIHTTLPDRYIDNMEYVTLFGEKAVKKQIKVTGMRYRYLLKEKQTALDLGFHSAKKLLEETDWNPKDIDFVVYVSVCKEYTIPSRAFEIIERLGIGEDCVGFDMNLGCTAYVSGLHTIASLISQRGKGTKGLLISTDAPSMYTDVEDKSMSMLQSDCGSATLLEWDADAEPIVFDNHSDGGRYEKICCKSDKEPVHMDGLAVFEFAISDVADSIRAFFKYNKKSIEDIDYTVLHQAQKFIVDKVVIFGGLSKEKNLIAYDRYGNAGCASIPLTLCENREVIQEKKQDTELFVCGFGSGLAWESMFFHLCPDSLATVEFI